MKADGNLGLLAIGPWADGEFQVVRQAIDRAEQWPIQPSLDEAVRILGSQAVAPELLLLAQPRPGYYRQSDLERLMSAAPLCRVILVAGTWCEGELRTGSAPQGVLRLYWYEMAAWWRRSMTLWSTGQSPVWSYPLGVHPLEEQHGEGPHLHGSGPQQVPGQGLSGMGPDSGHPSPKGLVEIDSPRYETFDALSAALAPYGWSTLWQPRRHPEVASSGPVAGIWDGGQFDPPEIDQLSLFCRRQHDKTGAGQPVPVIVLLDFPRKEHIAMAVVAGAAAVLAKPYRVADLLELLRG